MPEDKLDELRKEIDRINHRLLSIIADRQEVSVAIGTLKAAHGLALYSEQREAELLETFRRDATRMDLDPDYVEELMRVVLEHSRAAQRRKVGGDS
ncbi:MAG: chorismate mutase [Acidimicrobiia bacterium]|jgi:chorismate mutase/prephenate dehydrogenase